MSMYCENPYQLNLESDCGKFLNHFSGNFSEFNANSGPGPLPIKQSLVFDGDNGELVKTSEKKKYIGISEDKTVAALKSHSEAERRRRDRINAHFANLRGLVPNSEKMDKATLLAEVINRVKHLKQTASIASEGLNIPMDTDEVDVKKLENNSVDARFLLQASLCCDYRPDVLSDVRQAINELPVQLIKCEISTLGGRLKSVFLLTNAEQGKNDNQELIVSSVRAALCNIVDKVNASAEYAQQLFFPRKRRRISDFDSSSLSS